MPNAKQTPNEKKAITNPELVEALKALHQKNTPQNQNRVLELVLNRAVFLSPAVVTPAPQQPGQEDRQQKLHPVEDHRGLQNPQHHAQFRQFLPGAQGPQHHAGHGDGQQQLGGLPVDLVAHDPQLVGQEPGGNGKEDRAHIGKTREKAHSLLSFPLVSLCWRRQAPSAHRPP